MHAIRELRLFVAQGSFEQLVVRPFGAVTFIGERDLRRHARGEVFVFARPGTLAVELLVAQDADVASEGAHRHVEHRIDAHRLEVGRRKLARARIVARIFRGDDQLLAQRVEVGRTIRALQQRWAERPGAVDGEHVFAADGGVVGVDGPEAHAADIERRGEDLEHPVDRLVEIVEGLIEQHLEGTAIVSTTPLRRLQLCVAADYSRTDLSGISSHASPQGVADFAPLYRRPA